MDPVIVEVFAKLNDPMDLFYVLKSLVGIGSEVLG